jgi:hypothetical protein
MGKRRRQTFSELLQAERERPARTDGPRLPPGRHDDVLVLVGGERWVLVAEGIDPAAAQRLVRAGSQVAFDPCGCGGACGIEVLGADVVDALADADLPQVSGDPRYPGSLFQWAAEDDPSRALVLASGRVTWGHALA